MLRRLLIVIVFLLIGVVVNYGVALGLVLRYPDLARNTWPVLQHEYRDNIHWFTRVFVSPGSIFVYSRRDLHPSRDSFDIPPELSARQHTPRLGGLHQPRSNLGEALLDQAVELETRRVEARGWPMYAFWCEYHISGNAGKLVVTVTNDGGIRILDRRVGRYLLDAPLALPTRPIPLGFAVNTIMYAAIVTTVVATLSLIPRTVIRLVRKSRRRCPACGYPVGESERCSECGASIKAGAH